MGTHTMHHKRVYNPLCSSLTLELKTSDIYLSGGFGKHCSNGEVVWILLDKNQVCKLNHRYHGQYTQENNVGHSRIIHPDVRDDAAENQDNEDYSNVIDEHPSDSDGYENEQKLVSKWPNR
jgi:hypothetical protein